MDELLQDFLDEANDHLEIIEGLTSNLEKKPDDHHTITQLFRSIHSIKGTCGMFGFEKLSQVSHKAEDLLSKMREKEILADQKVVDLLFTSFDVIRAIVGAIEKNGQEPDQNFEQLCKTLDTVIRVFSKKNSAEDAPSNEAPLEDHDLDLDHNPELEEQLQQTNANSPAGATLKVKLNTLDKIMNWVSELVLIRNRLEELTKNIEVPEFLNSVHQLDHVTTALQESAMSTRLRPIEDAWNKLPRIIRDLQKKTKKDIQLTMSGEQTELDRNILSAIQDPMVHCIRNSADHGLEDGETRKASGKQETGNIYLHAEQNGKEILVSIKDDGRGINPEVIKEKCIEKGLITKEEADSLSREQALSLIFKPGFSTAKAVSDISGRGVGMDVVKTSVEQLGGSVAIDSVLGEYTQIQFKIPLTMAIVPSLTLELESEEQGRQVFAIPQSVIVELINISEKNLDQFNLTYNTLVYHFHGQTIPIINLYHSLYKVQQQEPLQGIQQYIDKKLIILNVNGKIFGALFDHVLEAQEIVSKSISSLFESYKVFSGASILGNGQVVLIIDPQYLLDLTQFGEFTQEAGQSDRDANQSEIEHKELLIFQSGEQLTRRAVDLEIVDRLEEFKGSQIEQSGDQMLTHYRGELLPLACMDQYCMDQIRSMENIPTIIVKKENLSFGLITKQILDVHEYKGDFQIISRDPKIQSCAIIENQSIDIVNTEYFTEQFTHVKKVG
jgi:two-component system chemotaxis sensor kinase CheA